MLSRYDTGVGLLRDARRAYAVRAVTDTGEADGFAAPLPPCSSSGSAAR